jgi:hypothetical protein
MWLVIQTAGRGADAACGSRVRAFRQALPLCDTFQQGSQLRSFFCVETFAGGIIVRTRDAAKLLQKLAACRRDIQRILPAVSCAALSLDQSALL